MKHTQNTLIPNSFQTPNLYIDRLMPLLLDAEFRVLMFAVRHILGWSDTVAQRACRLSLSAFEHGHRGSKGVGLGRKAIVDALASLETYGVLQKIGEPTGKGQMWGLPNNEDEIDWEGLKERKARRQAKARRQTQAARAKGGNGRREQGVDDAPSETPSKTDQDDDPPTLVSPTHQQGGLPNKPVLVSSTNQQGGLSSEPVVSPTHQQGGSSDKPAGGSSNKPIETHKKPKEQKPTSQVTNDSHNALESAILPAAVPDKPIDSRDQGIASTGAPEAAAAAAEQKNLPEAQETGKTMEGNTGQEAGQVFKAYEDNIGALTPFVAQVLGEAIDEYGAAWVKDAISEAVVHNVRKWKYIEAILKRRKQDSQPRSVASKAARYRYLSGEYSEFVNA